VAAKFEYWTAVFGVGLEGFSDYDHDELNAIAAEGWEPVNMTAIHNGFATVVLFRREVAPAPRTAKAAAGKAAASKAAASKAAAKKAR
jgi:hypothetical protein